MSRRGCVQPITVVGGQVAQGGDGVELEALVGRGKEVDEVAHHLELHQVHVAIDC